MLTYAAFTLLASKYCLMLFLWELAKGKRVEQSATTQISHEVVEGLLDAVQPRDDDELYDPVRNLFAKMHRQRFSDYRDFKTEIEKLFKADKKKSPPSLTRPIKQLSGQARTGGW
jgi:hypothetical protein